MGLLDKDISNYKVSDEQIEKAKKELKSAKNKLDNFIEERKKLNKKITDQRKMVDIASKELDYLLLKRDFYNKNKDEKSFFENIN